MLQLVPDSFLVALESKDRCATAVLLLRNCSSDVVAYKVKPNRSSGVKISDARGVLLSSSSIKLTVSLDSDVSEDDDNVCKVQITSAPYEEATMISDWEHASTQVTIVKKVNWTEFCPRIPVMRWRGDAVDTKEKIARLLLATAELLKGNETLKEKVAAVKCAQKPKPTTAPRKFGSRKRILVFGFLFGALVAYLIMLLLGLLKVLPGGMKAGSE